MAQENTAPVPGLAPGAPPATTPRQGETQPDQTDKQRQQDQKDSERAK